MQLKKRVVNKIRILIGLQGRNEVIHVFGQKTHCSVCQAFSAPLAANEVSGFRKKKQKRKVFTLNSYTLTLKPESLRSVNTLLKCSHIQPRPDLFQGCEPIR
jgi:hypothetical protein